MWPGNDEYHTQHAVVHKTLYTQSFIIVINNLLIGEGSPRFLRQK